MALIYPIKKWLILMHLILPLTTSVIIKHCPIGMAAMNETDQSSLLIRNNRNETCACQKTRHSSTFVNCHKNGTLELLTGHFGYLDRSSNTVLSFPCPFGYCKCKHELEEGVCRFDEHNQCAESRMGFLCSQCKPGLSVLMGSEDCNECTHFYLLLSIPIVVVMSLFILFVMYFNFDAFSGYLNAFLYSHQMMILFLPSNIKLDRFALFLVRFINFQGTGGNFGICLFDGMNDLHKFALSYLLPAYMLAFTITVGIYLPESLWLRIFSRHKRASIEETVIDIRRKSFGRAISLVLVICYSSFTSVTLDIMDFVYVNQQGVVYKAAFAKYLGNPHMYYWTLAVFVAMFIVVLFPLILCFTPYFEKHFPCAHQLHRCEPILNALKDCFKDNLRWFASFYFICRLILLMVTMLIKSEVSRTIYLSICNIIFQSIFSLLQPYKNQRNNFWDILLLTNLCVISSMSLILQIRYSVSEDIRSACVVLLKVLIYFPLLSIFARLAFYLYKKYRGDNDNDNTVFMNPMLNERLQRWKRSRSECFPEDRSHRVSSSGSIPERVFDNLNKSN